MSALHEPGDRVAVRANPEQEGVVIGMTPVAGGTVYEVWFSRFQKASYPEHQLIAVGDGADGDGSPVDLLRRWRFADVEDFRAFLTVERLRHPLASTVYSYLGSRTELLPYQFKPVLKLLDNPYSRLLIADEVGLGKTIEAGIVLTELHARSPLNRVLVVCPSALLEKWRGELLSRFGFDFTVLRGPAVTRTIRDAASSLGKPLRMIVSLETLRREEAMEVLQEYRLDFDVVIVDEAHHMRNTWTRANELGEYLSTVADTMLFLTATPLNLGRPDFFELLHLLVPEEFDDLATFEAQIEPNAHLNAALQAVRAMPPDLQSAMDELRAIPHLTSRRTADDPRFRDTMETLRAAAAGERALTRTELIALQRTLSELNTLSHVFARTRKREVQPLFPLRRADPVPVEFDPDEREFYDAVSSWVRSANERYGVGVGAFVLINYQRQLASCLPAAGAKLENTVLRGVLQMAPGEVDDVDDENLDIDIGADPDLAEPFSLMLDEPDDETLSSRMRRAWQRVKTRGVDSKFEAFTASLERLLRAGERKVLVFSFFVGTIDYLERRLGEEGVGGQPVRVLKLYGPTPADQRTATVEAFADAEEPVVLLSSEVGSEGLDFQFCSAMFNYDLPWNPMRVEQRIGRLDRYGQRADSIQILNLVVPDTIEGRIFYRLYDRIDIFRQAIGDLEAILGDEQLGRSLIDLKRDVVFGALTPDEEEHKAELIARAIEQKKMELEEFDELSRRFVGQDEVFGERFHDIERGHRYIAPDELRSLVQTFLARELPGVRIVDAKDRPGVFRFGGRDLDGLYDLMRDRLREDPQTTNSDWTAASRLVAAEGPEATFDARHAVADRRLEFVTISHPLIRAITERLGGDSRLSPVGSVRVRVFDGAEPGRRLFFLFRAAIEGIKPEVDFVAVAVSVEGVVDVPLSLALPDLLASADGCSCEPEDWLREEVVATAESAAFTYVEHWRAEREEEGRRFADAVVEAQLESLRLGFERRIARIDAREAGQENERMLRLLRGQRRNTERRYERKRAEIERKRDVAVGLDLVAAGVVEVAAD